jgi:hypothetical protein
MMLGMMIILSQPYDIDMDIDTILINAAQTQAFHMPCECWNQISARQWLHHLETNPNRGSYTLSLD